MSHAILTLTVNNSTQLVLGPLVPQAGAVNGPGSSTDNAVVRFDGTAGGTVQDSLVTIDDTGNVAVPALATVDGRDISVDGAALDAHIGAAGAAHALVSASDAGFQPQSNRSAVVDPTATDDSSAGYAVGSYWINTATDSVFVCADDTAAAAVWQAVDAGSFLAIAAPADVDKTAAAVGSGTRAARDDHKHDIATGSPAGLIGSGTANAEGTATDLARADHTHEIDESGSVAALTPAGTTSNGVALGFARKDHVHSVTTAAAVGLDADSANAEGTNLTYARSDHTHEVSEAGTVSTIEPDDAAADGTAIGFARKDHTHAIAAGIAVELTDATNAEGTSTDFARRDHQHAHGNRGGGSLHAVTSSGGAGFQPQSNLSAVVNPLPTDDTGSGYAVGSFWVNVSTDSVFICVDATASAAIWDPIDASGLLASTAPEDVDKSAASIGVGTTAARADHKHDIDTAAASSLDAASTSAEGSAASLARSDHTHAIDTSSGAISTVNAGDSAAEGAGAGFSRRDHEHAVATASAVELTDATNAEGVSTSLARADHMHSHGSRGGGTLHATTSASADGFAPQSNLSAVVAPTATDDSAAGYKVGSFWVDTALNNAFVCVDATASAAVWDPIDSDALLTSSAPVDVTKAAAVVGVATTAARADHKHDVSTGTPSSTGTSNQEGSATSLARSDHVHALSAHAASHSDGGTDEVTVENLATAGAINTVPTSDGAGGLTMALPAGEVDQQQIYYVGKHGSDSNDGLSIGRAFLTIGKATTDVTAQTPSTSNRFTTAIADSGIYAENVTLPNFTDLDASNATIQSSGAGTALSIGQESTVRLYEVIQDTGTSGIVRRDSSSISYAFIDQITLGATGAINGVSHLGTTTDSVLQLEAGTITVGEGIGIAVNTVGHMHFDVEDIYLTGNNSIGILRSVAGTTLGRVTHILELGTPTGTTAINVSGGRISARVDTIAADTAWNIGASGQLDLYASDVTGTRTETGTANITEVGVVNAHASQHADGGTDELDVADLGSTSAAGANLSPLSDGAGGVSWAAAVPAAHASTHLPSGGDPLTTATANTISVGAAAAEGSAESFARSDHTHALTAPAAPVAVDKTAASAGISTTVARADHKHDITTAAANTITIGAAAAEGAGTALARNNHVHAVPAPPAPADVTKAAASAGAATTIARSDHKHDVSTAAASSIDSASTSTEGSATSLARSDHTHEIDETGTVSTIEPDDAAADGAAAGFARKDHTHAVVAAAPSQGIGGSNAEGSATSFARSDHDHAIRTTSGPTDLTVAAIAAGELVERSGTTLAGVAKAGIDSDAIHDNVAAEISAVTEKTAAADDDLVLIEDSAAANAKKRMTLANLLDLPHAALFSENNSAAQTLTPQSTFIQVNSWETVLANHRMSASTSTDDLTCDEAGTYLVFFSVSFEGTVDVNYQAEIFKNGVRTSISSRTSLGDTAVSADIDNMVAMGFVSLALNDTIELYARNYTQSSATFRVKDGQLGAIRIGP